MQIPAKKKKKTLAQTTIQTTLSILIIRSFQLSWPAMLIKHRKKRLCRPNLIPKYYPLSKYMIVKVYAAMLTEQKPISKQCINELEMDTKKAIFGSNYFFIPIV